MKRAQTEWEPEEWSLRMETLLLDLKHGLRLLVTNRAVTVIAVLTLALGIGANTTVFTMLKGIALRPCQACGRPTRSWCS